MTDRTKFLIASLVIFLAVIGLYYSSLRYNFIGLDDNELVVRNPDIKVLSFDRLWHLVSRPYITLYIPLTMLSYMTDYQIWYLTPFGFHFTNLILHFLNSLLVLRLVKLLHKNLLIAFASALIFAVHPVQIESVVWIAERKNLLSTFSLFLAFISYWKAGHPSIGNQTERKWLTFSLVAYIAGLLSKPSAVIFLPMIFAFNHFIFDGSWGFKKRTWFYTTVIVTACLSTVATILGTATDVEKYIFHGGSYWSNLLIMITVFWRYIDLLWFPYKQNILYSSLRYNSFLNPAVFWSIIGLMLFFIGVWVIYKKRNKIVCFWVSWFVISLLPVSNLLAPLPSIMNDRYLYVPIVGFFTALFILLEQWSSGFLFASEKGKARTATLGFIFAFALPFVILTIQRLPDWKNAESLWTAAFKRSPIKDPRIFYFSGINQIDSGNYDRAVELLKESLRLDPTIDTRLALGTAYVVAEKFGDAESHLKKVIELDPGRAGAYDQLGTVYQKTHRYQEAEEAFKKALTIQPRNAVIHNNYALLKMDLGRPEEARQLWEYSLEIDPDCHFTLRNLSWYYFMQGEWQKAASYLVRYLRQDPTDRQMLNMAKTIQDRFERGGQKSIAP